MSSILRILTRSSVHGLPRYSCPAFAGLLLPIGLASAASAPQHRDARVDADRAVRLGFPVGSQFELDAIDTVFSGTVVGKDGAAVANAVVVSSAGGRAVTEADGSFSLHVRLSPSADSVQVTAVASSGAGTLVSSTQVSTRTLGGTIPTGTLTLGAATGCPPSWLPTFSGAPGTDGMVLELAVFDDGGGPALYVGGDFQTAGGVPADNIARWDGSSWSALGSGTDADVLALTGFDDGSGPALYAGGNFSTAGGVAASRVAKWDGSSWSALGSGTSGSNNFVDSLAVFDDGGGPALYAGGEFTTAGGVSANRIARWNGSTWSALGSGMNFRVLSLLAFDDGGGPALFAGGWFTTAGGVAAERIAKWNGSTWSPLGSGANSNVETMTVFDDGSGPALFAGGCFDIAGGVTVDRVAKWDGSSWSALPAGTSELSNCVQDLTVFDDGGGPALYAGGDFSTVGGATVNRIAKWDGSSWSTVGGGVSDTYSGFVFALAVFDGGGGPALHVGGYFFFAGPVFANYVVGWTGSTWSQLGSGFSDSVLALSVLDDGSGPALYAGGEFRSVDGITATRIARWNGSSWSPLNGLNEPTWASGSVRAITVFDDGTGSALYAGGHFTNGGSLRRIAKWNGANWSALGLGLENDVADLEVFDPGSGPQLFATGDFDTAGTVAANRIARWNGSTWSVVGSGLIGAGNAGYALTVFDDGSGPALYVGGSFTTAGGVPATYIAKWNLSGWSAVGGGMNGEVRALQVFNDGGGAALYAGGDFTVAGGVPANRIAKWDGSIWSALGSGLNDTVDSLASSNDAGERALAVGGRFTTAGGVAANRIAHWKDSTWSALGSGMNDTVRALIDFDDGGGATLFAGGDFTSAPDSADSFLARWGCPTPVPGTPFCFGDGSLGMIACPCGNTGITGHGCANSTTSSRGALLEAFGSPSQDTVRLAASEERPAGLSIFLQGTTSTAAGLVYGDGIRCASGALKRLYNKIGSAGAVSAPGEGELSIRDRSAAAGDPIPSGATRYYQIYYRDPVASFCPSPAGNVWNVTNGIAILWP